jgi:hypothetical protein
VTAPEWLDFVERSSTEQHARILAARAAIKGDNVTSGPEFDVWVWQRNQAKGWRLRNLASIARRGVDRVALKQAWDRGARTAEAARRYEALVAELDTLAKTIDIGACEENLADLGIMPPGYAATTAEDLAYLVELRQMIRSSYGV